MSSCGFEPDNYTYPCPLKVCSGLNSLWVGLQIHGAVVKLGLDSNLFIGNGLVSMYGKCGCLVEARWFLGIRWLLGMRIVGGLMTCWSSMPTEAVDLYSQMDVQGIEPDAISVASVLPACGDLSALLLGKQIHQYVERKKLWPNLLLENALIDMYAKCGSLAEARTVFDEMNFGLLAADHLFRLAPEQLGYYVLLSNIYAKAGRWDDVMTVRSIMKRKGLKKMPSASNIEINGRVYTFLAGDQSHTQSKKIYEELDVLVGKMKEAGYVPETDSALHIIFLIISYW
ncbi:hypothetical protein EZV62_006016 [Acer yangbiense]|uniref:Uncharacterized protein n=1 Tax=Acer yangbiense TaxID=1000413 RepID=A0A5C7IP85_9ROSI|nr:hypothetical protein EZV62_006016 [Acer yangbiense]